MASDVYKVLPGDHHLTELQKEYTFSVLATSPAMANLVLLLPRAFISFFALLTFLFAIANLASWYKSVKDREWCADGIAYEDACKLSAKFIAAYILAILASAALLAITGLNFVNALRINSTGTRKNNTVAALVSLIVFVVYIVYLALISANGKNDVVSISSWDSGYGSSDVYVGAPGGYVSF